MKKTATKYRYLLIFTLPALAFYIAFAIYPLFSTMIDDSTQPTGK